MCSRLCQHYSADCVLVGISEDDVCAGVASFAPPRTSLTLIRLD